MLVALAAISQPASAQSTWEKLERGATIVSACAGDIVQHCTGVLPGGGRIGECMAAHLADLSGDCIKALAEPKPAVLSDGVTAKTTRISNSHLMRFIEMYLAGLDPNTGDIIAECYGSYAIPKIPANKDSSPQALVAALDMKKLKAQYGVLGASLNGPKLWIPDWFDVEVGTVRQFGGMQLPWTAQLNLGKKNRCRRRDAICTGHDRAQKRDQLEQGY